MSHFKNSVLKLKFNEFIEKHATGDGYILIHLKVTHYKDMCCET